MRSFNIVSTAVCLLLASVEALPPQARTTPSNKKVVSFEDVFSGNFGVKRTSLQWTSQGEDGTYVDKTSTGDLVLANIVTGNSSTFVAASEIGGAAKDYYDYSIQPSGDHVLFIANYTKLYRYTFYADYYVYNVKDKTTVPLVADQAGDIQYAGWSPVGNTIAYARGNNLYIWSNGTSTQITKDGGPDVFNAIPDWVYEEEIYGTTSLLWFSPDGKQLAYLSIDETGVPTYQVPYYMDGATAGVYPDYLQLRYPKVGETNPTVKFNLLSLENLAAGPSVIKFDSFTPENLIIGEVAWVTDTSSHVIFRSFNRVQDQEKLILVDTATKSSSVVRERKTDPGWIDNNLAISYIPGTQTYVDLSDESGWQHIYLYPVNGSTPVAITKGKWEVASILYVDSAKKTLYYTSTERNSMERHLYSVGLDGKGKKSLVDDSKPGVWTASFSAGGGYYILSYNGPDLPYQKLYSTKSHRTAVKTINDNAVLAGKLANYTLPKTSWFEMKGPDGYTFNVMERLPPNFDANKKYPVIFDPYGGPGNQRTTKTFRQVDFRAYLASDPELEYILLVVDNRGTGFKGRAFREVVAGQLGTLEAIDQVYAAKEYGKRSYVDASKITIFGWSYGGYLAGKVLELDSDAFSFAILTAPVSDWRFYDSMYTERYMKLLSTNEAGYNTTAIRKSAGFQNVRGGFLIQHGTGDDNVHFQNSAVLVDTLTVGKVSPKKFHVQWFTDSDHGISFHGATTLIYKQMARYFWLEKTRKDEGPHQFDKK
ncbi:dipeptidyl peptidase IV N-terminal region-domain-containing protein [Rhexocercosporidium sp. MPI-PUGE-AT-0058]|nr:dipeptidyl peptidase IV N-terminal region-domain-containing protein [Rhexocercosporidium sp. MPI-PUGE-AT-0058]